MSKLSFRARALDATKPLPIYNAVDLPDLSEYSTINRTVPQMPTGMEKEEETERHLVDVIQAQQTNRNVKHVVIPTPENAINVPYYEGITTSVDKPPAQYIRLPGLRLDEEVPDYDLDSEDEEWLSLQTNEKPLSSIHFECMMDKLEKGSGNTVLSERDAQALLRDDEDLVMAVYEYWLVKRLKLGRALIPTVKQERRDGTASGNNPYLAFRKRTEKMQTRKNRKNDETAYMQMQKLKRDLDKAFTLSGMVKERETKKHELANIQMDIFKKRYMLEDWSGSIMSSLSPVATQSATSRQNTSVSNSAWDGSSVLIKMEGGDDYDVHQVGRHEVLVASTGIKRKSRKRKYYFPSNSIESPLPPLPATPDKTSLDHSRNLSSDRLQGDEDLDGKYTFRRKPYVKYCPARAGISEWPWDNDLETDSLGGDEGAGSDGEGGGCTTRAKLPKAKKFRFSRLTLSGQYIGLCRRRVGRGGRVALDRLRSDFDETGLTLDADSDLQMEAEASLDSSSSLPASSTPSSSHTPTTSVRTSNSHTPSLLARQQSEIVGSSASASCVAGEKAGGLLVRSQSMQVTASPPKDTPTASAESASQKEEEESKPVVKQPTPIKNFHYMDLPSSPTSNKFESSDLLPFIKPLPPGLDSPSEQCPPHYAIPGVDGYARGTFSLQRLPSFSEYREEMTNFSSLPTSHFTLRPSSSDAELEQSPTQFWNQTSFGYKSTSDGWNWNQTAGERASWQRKSSGEQISGISNTSTYLRPAPSNYGSNLTGSARRPSSQQQQQQQQVATAVQETAVDSNKKEMSRSSLSVTDSKTIVLTNSPGPWRAAAEKKKEVDKVLSQQKNHKLVNSVSLQQQQHKVHRAEDGAEGRSKKPRLEEGVVDAKAADVTKGSGSSADDAKSGSDSGSGVLSNASGKSEGKADAKRKSATSSGGSAVQPGVKDAESAHGEGARTPSASASAGVNTGVSNNPSSTSAATGVVGEGPAPLGKKDADKADASASAETKMESSEPPPKVVDVWKMRGPANGILALNAHKNAKRQPKKKPKNNLVGFNLEAANVVTSQLTAKAVKRKEEGSVGGLGGGDSIVAPLGGILVRGAATAGSRSGSNTPTILGAAVDMTTQQVLPGIGTVGAATVSGLGVGRLSAELQAPPTSTNTGAVISQPLQENMVIAKGVEVKRTNSIGSDGVGVHVTLSSQSSGGLTAAHHPTGSAGTNGTNFKEIFNSKRKLSENSERGLKQALAGTVMNHNSLLESTTKPLLPQTIKNSSEVT